MRSFTFIGLGLTDERGITLEGLEEARRADKAFAELYTNIMPQLDLQHLESLIGKKVHVLNRTQLEDEGGHELLNAARQASIAFFVPGDPMVATTHISLSLSLYRIGIKPRIVHAPSIVSSICGATGLQSYKFGKSVTLPYDDPVPPSVGDTVGDNFGRGLHTLLLLDVKANGGRQLTIADAVAKIRTANPELEDHLAVGVARIGARDEHVKAARIRTLVNEDFGGPPHSIVLAGKLHFMEAEALKVLCGAQDSDLREII